MGTSRTVADLISRVSSDPGRPRITWYAAGGERVELSGRVLENWVAKTTNMLVEEFDAGPGVRVLLDMSTHWTEVVWALSVWRAGATPVLVDDIAEFTGPLPGVVVALRPEQWMEMARAPQGVSTEL